MGNSPRCQALVERQSMKMDAPLVSTIVPASLRGQTALATRDSKYLTGIRRYDERQISVSKAPFCQLNPTRPTIVLIHIGILRRTVFLLLPTYLEICLS